LNQESRKAGRTPQANDPELEAALARGLADVQAGRVQPMEDVRSMIPQWIANVQSEVRA
jgi:predicted transcriptional regulator